MKKAVFYAQDLCDFRFDRLLHPKIDVVSSMFSLQYTIQSDRFKTMVRSLIIDKALHESTRWLIYVPNVAKRSSKHLLDGTVRFEHEPDDHATKVTIEGHLDNVVEPRIHFRTHVIAVMKELGFECEDHGSTERLYNDCVPSFLTSEDLYASNLFHWGIFRLTSSDD